MRARRNSICPTKRYSRHCFPKADGARKWSKGIFLNTFDDEIDGPEDAATPVILVVQDDAEVRRGVSAELNDQKLPTLVVPSGAEASNVARTHPVAVVLIDMGNPEVDGIAALQRLRLDAISEVVPVIMVSDRDDWPTRQSASDIGIDEFLTRPFDGHELLARIGSAIELNRSRVHGMWRADVGEEEIPFGMALREQIQTQKYRMLSQVASSIANDFNNILSAIYSYGQFIKCDGEAGEQAQRDATEILAATERALRIVQDLKFFGVDPAGNSQAVPLGRILEDVQPLLSRFMGDEIDVVIEDGAHDVYIPLGRGEINHLIFGLAAHRREAMKTGGKFVLRTEICPVGTCDDSGSPGEYVMISVADDGEGIDGTTLNQLFDPDFSSRPEESLTNLTLATLYRIIDRVGGGTEVESSGEKGAIFTIHLPAVENFSKIDESS